MTKETIFHSVKLMTPNKLGGHNIYPSSHGFSFDEVHHIGQWLMKVGSATSYTYLKDEGYIRTINA
jgi:hypothetical protein